MKKIDNCVMDFENDTFRAQQVKHFNDKSIIMFEDYSQSTFMLRILSSYLRNVYMCGGRNVQMA